MERGLRNKKRGYLLIAIIFIAIFTFAIISALKMLNINTLSDLQTFISNLRSYPQGWSTILIICGILFITIFCNPITIGFVVYTIIKFLYNSSKRKYKVIPRFDLKYFRDDLSDVSPAIASFLIHLEVDADRDVPAHFLKLMLDGYINEKNNKYSVTNKDQSGLNSSDKKLLEYVNNNFNPDLLSEYENLIVQDAIKLDFVKRNGHGPFLLKMVFFPFVLCFLVMPAFTLMDVFMKINEVFTFVLIAILSLIMIMSNIAIPVGIIMYIFIVAKNGSYRRTSQGNKLLEQIIGLKNFLKDFSNLDKSTKDELVLREYYLVYAVALDINDNIDDEIIKKIRKQIKSQKD